MGAPRRNRESDGAGSATTPRDAATADPAPSLPHCIACGVCCFSDDPEYVRVFAIDLERMDARARGFTVERAGRVAMRMGAGRCAALVVDPVARTFTCDIYESRPDVCRSLARGSGGCLADRARKAEAPLVAIAALLAPRA